ncbi:MAG: SoxR reducing system RseC family protein, partial [Desulfobacteraceae bacterium]|nr:SoxR reducing system RseC family protein [Desulfobacteraceae bacterium]
QCHGGRAARTERTRALNRAGAGVGDRVMLTVESSTILSRMALLYLLPVFGILAGAFTGALGYGDMDGTGGGHSVVFGLVGFVLGFVLAVVISRIWSAVRPVVPVISRIVNARSMSPSNGQSTGCGCGAK